MDAWRTPLPPASRPIRIGQPYHGLLRGSVLSLSTGGTLQWLDGSVPDPDSTSGDCYVLRVPGTPAVGLAPGEVAAEAAAGREWRDYALLTGRARAYAGIAVGSKAWLYADAEGSVWRIECDMLDGASLTPSRLAPDQPEGVYPTTADFAFAIRRFGVIDPDDPDGTSAPTRSITLTAQSLGAAHASDPIYWDGFPAYPARLRHFPGDGVTRQYMPINIEDINSTGSHAIFCVNRTAEQSAIGSDDGRGVPKAWLDVAVTGVGLDNISISMSVLRVQPSEGHSWSSQGSNTTAQTIWPGWHPSLGESSTPPAPYVPYDIDVLTGAGSILTISGQVIGAYFDASDAVQWVVSEIGEVAETVSGSGSSQESVTAFPHEHRYSDELTTYWVDYLVNVGGGAHISAGGSAATGLQMGPHAYSPSPVTWSIDATLSWSSDFAVDGSGTVSYSGKNYSIGVFGGALGDYQFSTAEGFADVPVPLGGAMTFDYLNTSGVHGSGSTPGFGGISSVWYYGGVLLRAFDGLMLVRITNKVYGAVAVGPISPHSASAPQFPTGTRIVALGTPDGWVTGSEIGTHTRASYQPETGEFAHSDGSLGWV